MQFGTVVDMALVFCFNIIIIATAIWALLRVPEKVMDIALKVQEYEQRKNEVVNGPYPGMDLTLLKAGGRVEEV